MCAEEHQALIVHVDAEGIVSSHEHPHSDAKLAALNEQRVGNVPLGLDIRLIALALEPVRETRRRCLRWQESGVSLVLYNTPRWSWGNMRGKGFKGSGFIELVMWKYAHGNQKLSGTNQPSNSCTL